LIQKQPTLHMMAMTTMMMMMTRQEA